MNYDNVKAHIHPKSAAQRQRTLPYGHQCSLCIIWNILFYHKLERKCIANACQFVIIYYKLGRSCSANAFQFVIIYYKLGRNCITYAFQFVIIYYKLERYYKLGRNTPLHNIKPTGVCIFSQRFNSTIIFSGSYYQSRLSTGLISIIY